MLDRLMPMLAARGLRRGQKGQAWPISPFLVKIPTAAT
jgi:hypothetical protein